MRISRIIKKFSAGLLKAWTGAVASLGRGNLDKAMVDYCLP